MKGAHDSSGPKPSRPSGSSHDRSGFRTETASTLGVLARSVRIRLAEESQINLRATGDAGMLGLAIYVRSTSANDDTGLVEAALLLQESPRRDFWYYAGMARRRLATGAHDRGDHGAAEIELIAAASLFERSGSMHGAPMSFHQLGRYALERGDLSKARRSAETALELTKAVRMSRVARRNEALCADLLADVFEALGDHGEATRLYRSSLATFTALGDGMPPALRAKFARLGLTSE